MDFQYQTRDQYRGGPAVNNVSFVGQKVAKKRKKDAPWLEAISQW